MASLSAPGSGLLLGGDREKFSVHFRQDLEFFRLLLLLFNKACPIRSPDLVWSERLPGGKLRVRHLGTRQALGAPWSRLLGVDCCDPYPEFCNLINDQGRREAESCAVSEAHAERMVKATRRPYVYRCRFGLTDIAVPVLANGRHIGTLFTGRVLRKAPSKRGFARAAKMAAQLGYVDLDRLAEAYWKLPVVSDEDIRTTVWIVQAFAEWLGRSWSRIQDVVGEERRKQRELALAGMELAYWALETPPRDPGEVRSLMARLGIHRPLNRVLVVKLQPPEVGSFPEELLHEVQSTSALQALEDVREAQGNLAFARLPSGDICVFFHDPACRDLAADGSYARSLASRLHYAIRQRSQLRVRVGVGNCHETWRGLKESYREACAALSKSEGEIVTYSSAEASLGEPHRLAFELPRLLAAGNVAGARLKAASLAALIGRSCAAADLEALRLFFTSCLQSLCLAARKQGCSTSTIETIQNGALAAFKRAPNIGEMARAWRKWSLALMDEVALLESGRRKKIAARACRLIDERLESGCGLDCLCAKTIAGELGVSRSHFSRIFRQEVGQTFASYLTMKRIQLAQRIYAGQRSERHDDLVSVTFVSASRDRFCAKLCLAYTVTCSNCDWRMSCRLSPAGTDL